MSGYFNGSDTPLSDRLQDRTPSYQELSSELHKILSQPFVAKPKPAIRKTGSSNHSPAEFAYDGASYDSATDDDDTYAEKLQSTLRAQERAKKLAVDLGSNSEPLSRKNSIELTTFPPGHGSSAHLMGDRVGQSRQEPRRPNDGCYDSEDDHSGTEKEYQKRVHDEARNLVRSHTWELNEENTSAGFRSGQVTPDEEQRFIHNYVPKPKKYKGGILSSLMKLYGAGSESLQVGFGGHLPGSRSRRNSFETLETPRGSPPESGTTTPRTKHWYQRSSDRPSSVSSLAQLVGSSSTLAGTAGKEFSEDVTDKLRKYGRQAMTKRPKSSSKQKKARLEDEIKITVHIAEIISRQKYLVRLCRALMQYGAPTHRLEEYMKMSARVLEIESQFLYIPGCMIISFDDSSTHTTDIRLIRTPQGIDLGKLRDTHEIYKEVVHDIIGVEEATQRLKSVMDRPPKHKPWKLIPIYGLASLAVGPFAFQARPIDLPISFFLGCLLGIMQLILAPRSDLYSNVFEISAAVITSFLARAFGSIELHGEPLFCFSALAQSSIALILPGYTVLCASLELQSRSIVAGSVRMVYAIIYSLFLGFGITIGTTIYGIMDHKATSATTCTDSMSSGWYFLFVPVFTLCLIIINQGKWKQVPVMMFIAFTGYIVNFFSSKRFPGNTQISNTLGALAIGTMANLYSRLGRHVDNWWMDIWEHHIEPSLKRVKNVFRSKTQISHERRESKRSASSGASSPTLTNETYSPNIPRSRKVGYGLAAAAMLPAIFVQVPSGLAVSGSLVSGITSADQITRNVTGTTVVTSGNDMVANARINSVAFTVGFSVIQVAIGITVGLFLSALLVYPFGKKRSGLFSF
ncbi:DUF1212-domain-containing protein [Patellaria atrata CBS 101060]|uniref:DUF1212-domain-containing protein n=1 Tax=Patellaria atrata CBS 101060 TaxID=1346257 RepID=A0A9P4VMN3_9PEZI|nr:DUF1212-domain-containing protein [Patellaria atrata CBS 101060]